MDGFRLEYDRRGVGAPVLLLHGWPGDRTDFTEVADRLEADVTMPDLRGFGESDKQLDGDYSAAGQARSIVGLLDELGIHRAVLAGYDVGSRLAQVVAQQHPDRVAELVLAPPLPGIGKRVLAPQPQLEFWYQAFHQLDLAEKLIDGRPDAVRAYLHHFWTHWSGPAFSPSEDRIDHLTERYSAPGAFTASIGWYRSGAAAVARSLQETPPTDRITTPTTVLWPEFDPLFPREWSDRLDEWFTSVSLCHLDGVGHFSPIEAPDAFARAIQAAVTRTAA